MKPGDGIGTFFMVLALLLIFFTLMSSGCQGLKQPRQYDEDDRWVCPEYADLPLRQEYYEAAIELHLRVLSEEPDNAKAHYHLGYAYVQLGDLNSGIEEYLKALDLGLEGGIFFYNLGMAYGQLGRYQQAEQAFIRAIEIEPMENNRYHRNEDSLRSSAWEQLPCLPLPWGKGIGGAATKP